MAGETQFDESTTDPVALAAMFAQMEGGEAPPAAQQTPEELAAAEAAAAQAATEKAAADATAKAAADAAAVEAAKGTEAEADGVATKDGKHIIPYSVLQAERAKVAAAEQATRDAQAELTALKAAGKTGVTGEPAVTTPAAAEEMSDEDLAALKEDFPTVYKAAMLAKAQSARIAELEAKLKPVQDSVQNAEAQRQLTVAEQVQEAIDATPKLAHIMATDPAAGELAKQFDNTLKANPAWAGKTLAERFAKVIEMVELTNGTITVPGQQSAPPPATKTAEQLKAEAKAVAEATAKTGKTGVPTSLSDFPAGQHAAADEQEALTGMSTLQIADKMSRMTPDQLETYLQKL